MQKSLLDWKHRQNEVLEIQQELACMTPWSSGTLTLPPPSHYHTLSLGLFIYGIYVQDQRMYLATTTPRYLYLALLSRKVICCQRPTHLTSWSSVVNVHTIGLERVILQVVYILTRQVHPRLLQLCCCEQLTHVSWSPMIKGNFSEQGLSLKRCQQRQLDLSIQLLYFLLMN